MHNINLYIRYVSKSKNISIDYLFRTTWQCINKLYTERALEHNSTMTIGFVLINIHYKEGTPSTSLGPKMGIEKTSLSRTLKKMETDGLIYREKSETDGRSVIIKLTDKGKAQRETAKQTVLKFNEIIEKSITPNELEAVRKVSEKIKTLILENKIYQ